MTTVQDMKTLVDRIDGKADRMAAVDRLRAYIADPETFEYLHVDDAEEINELLLEASSCIDALLARLESAEKALKAIIKAGTVTVHVGYDDGSGGGNYVYADAVRTDDDAFVAARAHLSQYGERT